MQARKKGSREFETSAAAMEEIRDFADCMSSRARRENRLFRRRSLRYDNGRTGGNSFHCLSQLCKTLIGPARLRELRKIRSSSAPQMRNFR